MSEQNLSKIIKNLCLNSIKLYIICDSSQNITHLSRLNPIIK